MHRECINYLTGHVAQALAEDRRSCLLGIQVEIVSSNLYLIGAVETVERREAAELVARELAPEGMEVVNRLWVLTFDQPPEPERLH